MPYYEYHCSANGRTLEVRHGMDERLETWGELLERAGLADDGTPRHERVERLMSAPVPVAGSTEPAGPTMGCGSGCACAAPRA